MPWCEQCTRYWNPPSIGIKGDCPLCGTVIAEPPRAPWHFKLLIGATAAYLGWRLIEGVAWLADRF